MEEFLESFLRKHSSTAGKIRVPNFFPGKIFLYSQTNSHLRPVVKITKYSNRTFHVFLQSSLDDFLLIILTQTLDFFMKYELGAPRTCGKTQATYSACTAPAGSPQERSTRNTREAFAEPPFLGNPAPCLGDCLLFPKVGGRLAISSSCGLVQRAPQARVYSYSVHFFLPLHPNTQQRKLTLDCCYRPLCNSPQHSERHTISPHRSAS